MPIYMSVFSLHWSDKSHYFEVGMGGGGRGRGGRRGGGGTPPFSSKHLNTFLRVNDLFTS